MTLYIDSSETPDRRRHNGVLTGTEKGLMLMFPLGSALVCLFLSFFLSLYSTCKQKNQASVLLARPILSAGDFPSSFFSLTL